jgi:hypothetical protein
VIYLRGKTDKNIEAILPELRQRFEAGEDMQVLVQDYKIPKSTIYNYMEQLGAVRPDTRGIGAGKEKLGKRTPSPHSIIMQKEADTLAGEADKIATIAVGVGGPIARRYLPLIDKLMSEGKPLEAIAEEVMSWYERKATILVQIEDLEKRIAQLEEELGTAYAFAQPNLKYLLKLRALDKFARRVLRIRVAGYKLPIRTLLRSYQNELEQIDQDMAEIVRTKTPGVEIQVE